MMSNRLDQDVAQEEALSKVKSFLANDMRESIGDESVSYKMSYKDIKRDVKINLLQAEKGSKGRYILIIETTYRYEDKYVNERIEIRNDDPRAIATRIEMLERTNKI